MTDLIFFLGRFHVLALHLPIGIILAAVVMESLARRDKHRHLEAAVPFLLGAAAVTSIATVMLGYMHFAEGGFDGPSADLHRIYGTSVAVVSTLVWLLRTRWSRVYGKVRLAVGVLLLALVTLTGHHGGNLTHGSAYLTEYAPGPIRALAGLGPARPQVTNLAMADPYLDVVQPILEARCSSCHNEDKRQGELNLATYDSIRAGGETGTAMVPGNVDGSELYRRISLPADHEEFMPAEGKTPLTADEVAVLRWWIDAGAPRDVTLAEVEFDAEVEVLLATQLGLGRESPEREENAAASSARAAADLQLVRSLYDAGYLVRQVSQADPRLIVSVYSPGTQIAEPQLEALLPAAADIVELDLQSSGIDDADVAQLAGLVELERLRLSNNELTDEGVRLLAGLKKLETLNVYGNAGITDASADILAAMPSLGRLYLWRTGIGAEGIESLRRQRSDLAVE